MSNGKFNSGRVDLQALLKEIEADEELLGNRRFRRQAGMVFNKFGLINKDLFCFSRLFDLFRLLDCMHQSALPMQSALGQLYK